MFLPDFLQVYLCGGVTKSGPCRDPTGHTSELDMESNTYIESMLMRLPCFFNEKILFFIIV